MFMLLEIRALKALIGILRTTQINLRNISQLNIEYFANENLRKIHFHEHEGIAKGSTEELDSGLRRIKYTVLQDILCYARRVHF